MEDKYIGFNEKRMYIFGELVRKYWNENLNDISDLDELTDEIKNKYKFSDQEIPFIKDHIRLAMGLNPNGSNLFEEELDILRRSREIHRPIIPRVEGPCEYCGDAWCQCDTLGKYESPLNHKHDLSEKNDENCIECGFCASKCDFGAIAEKIEFLPVIQLLKEKKTPVYAVVAPAIAG